MMPLRPYQLAAIEETRAKLRQGKRSIVIALPTGAGKTRTACAIVESAHSRGGKVVWAVHRRELVQQGADEIRRCGVPCGIIAPWSPRTYEPVQVASIQTLIARELTPDATVLIVDECHHVVAETYFEIRKAYQSAVVIGLTATPCRSDGVGLGNAFEAIVAKVQPKQLIDDGHLVPCEVVTPPDSCRKLAEHPVDAYLEYAPGEPAIVFCSSVSQARTLAGDFATAGVPSRCVDGQMRDDDRVGAIAEYRAGRVKVLTSVNIFLEGFDAPETSCIILARRLGSELTYIQATGRGMRTAPGTGKTRCLVLDLMGSTLALGITPDADRIYSLDGKGVQGTPDSDPIRQCQGCGFVWRPAKYGDVSCPRCGFVRKQRPDPEVERQKMMALQAHHAASLWGTQRIAYLRDQLHLAMCKGYKLGWVMYQFKHKFGHWPNETIKRAAGWPEKARA